MISLQVIIASVALAAAEEPRVDFKVVTWYDRAAPIATFQYRGYDVRKGEYGPAVDAWLATMRDQHPRYKVVVRDVDLSSEPGPTERRKVGAVIQRELLAAAAEEGLFVAPRWTDEKREPKLPSPVPVRIRPSLQPWRFPPPSPIIVRPGPMPIPSPVPIPYPRPHP